MTKRMMLAATAAVLAALAGSRPIVQGQEPRTNRVAAMIAQDLRTWDARVDRMIRDGGLELRTERADPLVDGRRHRRYAQTVNGVPVYGGDIVQQTDATGLTVSIFGTTYDGIAIDTDPALSARDAQQAVTRATGIELGTGRVPRLVVLPREGENSYRLVYLVRAATAEGLTLYFVDARSGAIVDQRNDAHTQAAVGVGTGVLGDRKKVSASSQSGGFVANDRLRPPAIETYDMRANLTRTVSYLNGFIDLGASDFASDSDNDWTDGANVDAHTYIGLTYDYFFKRFGRRGLDNADLPISVLTHPVNRANAQTASLPVLFTYYLNAFYAGDGILLFGEGLPSNLSFGGQRFNYFSGALDIVAHELTHGVTDYSSGLLYFGESGALNEAFSDIMGTAVEFYYQQPGDGPQRADYLSGEDVVTPGGGRSMDNPGLFGDPDHYSNLYRGAEDNGGVHINSGIANQAYYLAVEGGTNRTSGLSVQGVGRANREQMEKVFYRAFTQLMPSNARFTTARAATIQAAIDLYGPNSAALRAVTDAWTAVGVN
jgi:bacillolysin